MLDTMVDVDIKDKEESIKKLPYNCYMWYVYFSYSFLKFFFSVYCYISVKN